MKRKGNFVTPSEVLKVMTPGEAVSSTQLMKRLPREKQQGVNDCLRRLEEQGRVKRTTQEREGWGEYNIIYVWEVA